MRKNCPGRQLRKAREARQWRLVDLSRLCGIAVPRLSAIENEHRSPSTAEWERLGSVLRLPLAAPRRTELPRVPRVWLRPEPRLNENAIYPASRRVAAARRVYGRLSEDALQALRFRDDRKLCEEFLEQARMDSSLEALLWLRLLAAGVAPHRASPHRVGFRRRAILDPSSNHYIGDCLLPCLAVKAGLYSCLLFPQVTLDTKNGAFRLDALACAKRRGARRWLDLEVDGGGHSSRFDLERETAVGLPTLRLSESEVTRPDLMEHLGRRMEEVLDESRLR